MQNYLDNLSTVKDILNESKVILSPTDTVWGLGCNAFSKEAISKIYEIKKRDDNKPFILLVDSVEHLKKYIIDIHPRVETLIHFHQRPLSVVYQANQNLPEFLTSPEHSIAIRVTKDPLLSKIIEMMGKPMVSTSANTQGSRTPSHFSEIESDIIEKVDYVFKERRYINEKNPPSMLIKFDEAGELIFLRK